eukprot:290354_1
MDNKVSAKQQKNAEKNEIIGYERDAIELGINAVNSPNDINAIADRLASEDDMKGGNGEQKCNDYGFDIELTQNEKEQILAISIDVNIEQLQIGQKIDHLNKSKKYCVATIIDKSDTRMKVHYDGWNSKGDEWSDYKHESHRYAKAGSISKYTNYIKYFALNDNKKNESNDNIQYMREIEKKLKICCKVIEQKILPFMKKISKQTFTEYLYYVHYYLFQTFINIKLKAFVTNEPNFNRFCNIYNEFYNNILNEISIETDTQQLQIDKQILLINYKNKNDSIISDFDRDKMGKITLKWHTINDTQMYCNDISPFRCLAVKRCQYLLDIFQQNFIKQHTHNNNNKSEDAIDFVSLFNKCICINNKYGIIDAINDFNHIHRYHINDIHKCKHLITQCENDICIAEKRNNYIENTTKNEYFGYESNEDINIIQLFVKYHIFLSHKQCLLRFIPYTENENKNESTIRNLLSLRTAKSKQLQFNKFATEVIAEKNSDSTKEQKVSDKTVESVPTFEFGQQFYYYGSRFEEQKGHNFIKKPKFDNLKYELLNNKIYPLPLNVYNSQLLKARNNTMCNEGKRMKAMDTGFWDRMYGIPVGSPLLISQMFTVTLYTNQTKMQYNFKKFGCRKQNENDTIEDIAEFNKEIGHWYWIFSGTVRKYGQKTNKSEKLYHGLNIKLLFNRFNPYFKSPISTTADLTVSAQFAKKGIILELRADGDGTVDYGLSVAWLSNYPEEREMVFAFAKHVYIADIRFIEKPRDLRTTNVSHLCALRLMDYIFNSNAVYNVKVIENKYQNILIK